MIKTNFAKASAFYAKALKDFDIKIDDVALFIPHQITKYLTLKTCEILGLPVERTVDLIGNHGNIGCSSIPLAIAQNLENGKLKLGSGQQLVIFGFGKRSNVPLNTDNIFSKLVESGSVVKMTDGAYAYTGLFLQVYRYFCRKIDEFGKKHFNGIQEFEESVLYPVKEYETGHYFESFPHHIMFQTTMKSDAELLERFSKNGTNDSTIFSNDNMKRPENVVRHAACVPIYPMLKDAYIPADSPKYYLISGKCFRNEGANVYELARLNEFYMKEFVCIGTLEQTLDMIKSARALWEEWIDTFNLNCTIETANDSFFASNYKKLKIFQILGDSKQEFRVYIPDGDFFCAVSSSNVHRTHFTKTYNIHNDNSFCQSSCFAFGIERLSYALLSQKGVDIDKWDEATRKEIFG